MRHQDTEGASTCNHVSSSHVGSDSMWVPQAHTPEPVPLPLVWYLLGQWPQCHRDWERMGRGGAVSPVPTHRYCTVHINFSGAGGLSRKMSQSSPKISDVFPFCKVLLSIKQIMGTAATSTDLWQSIAAGSVLAGVNGNWSPLGKSVCD